MIFPGSSYKLLPLPTDTISWGQSLRQWLLCLLGTSTHSHRASQERGRSQSRKLRGGRGGRAARGKAEPASSSEQEGSLYWKGRPQEMSDGMAEQGFWGKRLL